VQGSFQQRNNNFILTLFPLSFVGGGNFRNCAIIMYHFIPPKNEKAEDVCGFSVPTPVICAKSRI
jgi:hypothetical protein